jgi:hypothetical protein
VIVIGWLYLIDSRHLDPLGEYGVLYAVALEANLRRAFYLLPYSIGM